MKKLLLFAVASIGTLAASAQCTTTNATSCQCDSAAQTNCDLLPDITISWQALTGAGTIEYSQTSTDQTYPGAECRTLACYGFNTEHWFRPAYRTWS
ncbi:MAG TPA: hypothetical protein VK826_02780 [Bacteroidia bacterium]|nr:hypothetical protein [Bacteroidia bacterium]